MLRLHMATLWPKAQQLGDQSVADMAERTGISRSTLHRLAAGTKQPSLTTLWTLRDTYQLHLDTLVYDETHTNTPPAPQIDPAHYPWADTPPTHSTTSGAEH